MLRLEKKRCPVQIVVLFLNIFNQTQFLCYEFDHMWVHIKSFLSAPGNEAFCGGSTYQEVLNLDVVRGEHIIEEGLDGDHHS